MKPASRLTLALCALAALPLASRGQTPGTQAVDNHAAQPLKFKAEDFIKLPQGQNLGEVLGVTVNSRGDVVILNHPGSATTGPLYGNATTEIMQFDSSGHFVREIGHGVYALGYSHSARFDRHDNLWVVDKGTNSVIEFNPKGKVLMNLGRRPEGFDSAFQQHPRQSEAVARRRLAGWSHRRDLGPGRQHLRQRRLHQFAHRQVRQVRQLGDLLGQVRQGRAARRREPLQLRQSAQHAGRSQRQHLRGRPR